jgi:pimeloyl-ACP methyl ester carboxylesterase
MPPNPKIPEAGPPGWFEEALRSAQASGLSFPDPRPPVSKAVTVNGVNLRYLDWGNQGAPDFLFIHGFAQQAHSWDFAALAIQDLFHVVSMDQRGHGESGWAADKAYGFNDYLGDVGPFIKAARLKKPVLCGLSLGGRVSSTYASRNPQDVSGLVIVDSGPESRGGGGANIARFVSGPTEFDSMEELVERVRGYTRRADTHVRSAIVHSVRRTPEGRWAWKYDPAVRARGENPLTVEERWQLLANLRVPTLLIRGARSDILDADVFERMAAIVPNSTAVTVPDAGHRVSGDNPIEFNRVLRDFLLKTFPVKSRLAPEGR